MTKRLGSYRKYRFVISEIDKKLKGNINVGTFIFHRLNDEFKDEKFIKKLEKHFKKIAAIYSFEIDDNTNIVTLKIGLTEISKYFEVIDCNNCEYISITEKEQMNNTREIHRCKFFNSRVYHKCRKDGFLYPCQECNGTMFVARIYKRVRRFVWEEN